MPHTCLWKAAMLWKCRPLGSQGAQGPGCPVLMVGMRHWKFWDKVTGTVRAETGI